MTFRRAEGVLEQDLDDEVLLFRSGSSDVLHLNTVASDVWVLLDEPAGASELARCLSTAYGVDVQRVAQDLEPVLAILVEHGMVVECTDP